MAPFTPKLTSKLRSALHFRYLIVIPAFIAHAKSALFSVLFYIGNLLTYKNLQKYAANIYIIYTKKIILIWQHNVTRCTREVSVDFSHSKDAI